MGFDPPVNLDRISRQGPKIARKLLEKIVENGWPVIWASSRSRMK